MITNILNLLSASLRTHVVVNEAVEHESCRVVKHFQT